MATHLVVAMVAAVRLIPLSPLESSLVDQEVLVIATRILVLLIILVVGRVVVSCTFTLEVSTRLADGWNPEAVCPNLECSIPTMVEEVVVLVVRWYCYLNRRRPPIGKSCP